MTDDSILEFCLNGEIVTIDDPDPRVLLLDYLRSPDVGLTGAKKGCGQGGCGCCTVMLSQWDTDRERVVHRSINSCLHPLASLDGTAVTTVEGTGNTAEGVSEVQWAIAANNGSQCGYCTPGWVMTMHSFLAANDGEAPGPDEIEQQFDGNLCRCTGYRPILQAMKGLSPEYDASGDMELFVDTADCPPRTDRLAADFPDEFRRPPRPVHYGRGGFEWIRPVSLDALIEVLAAADLPADDVKLVVGNTSIGIYSLYDENPRLLIDVAQVPELRRRAVVDGVLEIGGALNYSELLELLEDLDPGLRRNPTVEMLHYMAGRTAGHIVRNAASLAGNTMLVARHVQEGGPFPSDLFTVLAAVDARLVLVLPDERAELEIPILEFAAAWGDDAALQRAIVVGYRIPLVDEHELGRAYKVALRHENSHSIVNAGFRVGFDDDGRVSDAALVLGGIGPLAFRATRTEEVLLGSTWDADALERAKVALREDVDVAIDASFERMAALPTDGFSDDYRRHLADSFLYQFFVHVLERRTPSAVPVTVRSAGERVPRPSTSGRQRFTTYPEEYPVSLPVIKLSAFEQAAGETVYTHDLPLPRRGLEGAMVTSARARARVHYRLPGSDERVPVDDVIEYLRATFPGFGDYVTCRDIQHAGGKVLQGLGKDEPLLLPIDEDVDGYPSGIAQWHGQQIGVVLAADLVVAQHIAHHVQHDLIRYEDAGEGLVTFATALRDRDYFLDQGTFPSHIWKIVRRDSELGWADGPFDRTVDIDGVECVVVENEHVCGGQIHFYMETQSAFAERTAHQGLRLIAATQSPDSVVDAVHDTIKLPQNMVEVRVPSVGGAYGGKTTRSPFTAALAALAAWKTDRPVKLTFARDVDTAMVGHRHPLFSRQRLAIGTGSDPSSRGQLVGLDAEYYFDGGHTYDCSFVVMDCLQLRGDTAYRVPNYATLGEVCRTNTTSNTAYRAFGLIQSLVAYEDTIDRAAAAIGMLPEDVRERNLYEQGDVTPYGQELTYCYMPDVWDYARRNTDFDARLAAVEQFNRENRWRKRGIALMPLKYGSGYNLTMLEQGGALVEVFKDGSVMIRHGGVEMGQGLRTKVTQIAANAMNLPMSVIETGVTDTHVVPNPVSTGASTGTALNGGAVDKAGRVLRERLESYCNGLRDEHGDAWCAEHGVDYWVGPDGWNATYEDGTKWQQIVGMAQADRVNLSAQVRYQQSGGTEADESSSERGVAAGLVFHEGASEEVDHFVGFTYSAACSEVEVDVLTGETLIRRSDIIYDMGRSLNPAIDVGQVEGAFLQGVGFVLTEELVYQADGPTRGNLNSVNTWEYKPPATSTLPIELNVDLYPREDAAEVPDNPNDLHSSKEVGEPPLVLATTVYLAVKRAVRASRLERGLDDWFPLDAPATVQRVREAAQIAPGELTV